MKFNLATIAAAVILTGGAAASLAMITIGGIPGAIIAYAVAGSLMAATVVMLGIRAEEARIRIKAREEMREEEAPQATS